MRRSVVVIIAIIIVVAVVAVVVAVIIVVIIVVVIAAGAAAVGVGGGSGHFARRVGHRLIGMFEFLGPGRVVGRIRGLTRVGGLIGRAVC